MKKLWTGKTAKQEMIQSIYLTASVNGLTILDALERTLSGGHQAPDGSVKRELQRYWDAASSASQRRVLSECMARIKSTDRLMGRTVVR